MCFLGLHAAIFFAMVNWESGCLLVISKLIGEGGFVMESSYLSGGDIAHWDGDLVDLICTYMYKSGN